MRYRISCQDNRNVYRARFALSFDAKIVKIESRFVFNLFGKNS